MDFEAWLQRENYRASTAHKTVRDIRRLRKRFFQGVEVIQTRNDLSTAQRFRGYLEAIGTNEDGFDAWLRQQQLGQRRKLSAKPTAKTPTRSFSEDDWKRLIGTLRRDTSPEATVLYVQAATGHRIGDILRLTRKGLSKGLRTGILQLERKGGLYIEVPVGGRAAPPWTTLKERWTEGNTVAEWICPTSAWQDQAGGGAYQRVRRHLRSIADRLGLDGRANLHRLRRTVGTRALRRTKDIHAVSQLLGHRSISSTEQYVNELRADEIAELQSKLMEE